MELNAASTAAVLRISGLSFHYDNRLLFDRFTLDLGHGITWLRGANGAGKTTLLKLLGGALAPHAGQVRLGDIDSATAPLAYRLRSYYCGGDIPALPWLTVQEILDLHVALYPGVATDALNDELRAFGMLATLQQAVTTLSLGQHKKLQLSLALALPVTLLLIDEPFNGLDADATAYLRTQLADPARLARQCIVLTSHLEPQVPIARHLQL